MKLTDKRIWKFEAAMLLCGVATVCIEALNIELWDKLVLPYRAVTYLSAMLLYRWSSNMESL